ncbi:hypothetical protein C8N40_102154 [Pontibacter mucosus]|uniref:Uncharacterized protein n=1 Tax=Pontibacter mucosus TaxID=1649266 RepID=A0A2T5YPE8_9BACT|nr:hypothetical protein [Pontibacter mucosus]PTX21181.1 hypothetical protein C8N40_102154 [Pontibacter mucosus]
MNEQNHSFRQTQRIRPKTGQDAEVLVESSFIKEELPLPYVLYPNIYGTFIGFASQPNEQIYFCLCNEPAINNYLDLLEQTPEVIDSNLTNIIILLSHDFPPLVFENFSEQALKTKHFFKYKGKICHKCNLATPSVRAMHPMYGGKFKQYYGWYIKQQYFHLGINQHGNYLESKCPDEIVELVKQGHKAHKAAYKELSKLNEMVSGPKRPDISDDEITYWSNVKMEEAETYKQLDKESRALHRELSNKIENIVRQEFGFRKVGEGWIGESILCKIVQRLFPEEQVIRHHRPSWLKGLELDIYIPKINLAFEYQGQQHYHPVKAWGGEKGLQKVKERDQQKRLLCAEKGVQLITVDYTEPLTENHIKKLIKNKG